MNFGLFAVVAAVLIVFALLLGFALGDNYGRTQIRQERPQPCVQTWTSELGGRYCLLDEKNGRWVK